MKQGYALLVTIVIVGMIMVGFWLWRVEFLKSVITNQPDQNQVINTNINNLQDQNDDYNQSLIDEINK